MKISILHLWRGCKQRWRHFVSARSPALKETPFLSEDNRRGVLLDISRQVIRLSMPKVVQIHDAVKTGKYKLGDDWVRDPARVQVVRELREEATKRAEGGKSE